MGKVNKIKIFKRCATSLAIGLCVISLCKAESIDPEQVVIDQHAIEQYQTAIAKAEESFHKSTMRFVEELRQVEVNQPRGAMLIKQQRQNAAEKARQIEANNNEKSDQSAANDTEQAVVDQQAIEQYRIAYAKAEESFSKSSEKLDEELRQAEINHPRGAMLLKQQKQKAIEEIRQTGANNKKKNYQRAADEPETPHQVIKELRNRMYVIGETTGSIDDFVSAEHIAANSIRDYIAKGDQVALVEKNDKGHTPLMAAAFMGYAEVVSELLKSENVRGSIDDVAAPNDATAWLFSNIAFQQSLWVCNPAIIKNPFAWVPFFVSQPYYLQSRENPYRKTRRLLEEAGAKHSLEEAKTFWRNTCKLQHKSTRKKIQKSKDVLETILALAWYP